MRLDDNTYGLFATSARSGHATKATMRTPTITTRYRGTNMAQAQRDLCAESAAASDARAHILFVFFF